MRTSGSRPAGRLKATGKSEQSAAGRVRRPPRPAPSCRSCCRQPAARLLCQPAGFPCSPAPPLQWPSRWSCPATSLPRPQPGSSTRLPPAADPRLPPLRRAWQALDCSSSRLSPHHPTHPPRVPRQLSSSVQARRRLCNSQSERMPACQKPGMAALGASMHGFFPHRPWRSFATSMHTSPVPQGDSNLFHSPASE